MSISVFLCFFSSHSCGVITPPTESVAKSLLQSLQSSTAIYVAQQRVHPQVFSDFVTPQGAAEEAMTLTLQNVNDRLTKVKNLESPQMTLTFKDGYQATYYLEGRNVTANYKEPKAKSQTIIIDTIFSYIIISLILAFPVFLICCRKGISVWVLFIIVPSFFPMLIPKFSKPAIYLYPEKPTEVNVILDKNINITLDVPRYESQKGWNVLANPDGKLIDLQPELTSCAELDTHRFGMEYAASACKNNNYPYIYWEGVEPFKSLPNSNQGWIIKQKQVASFLNDKLNYVGFSTKEKKDFLEYWVPKITSLNRKEYFIYFLQTEQLEHYLPMSVSPQPDSVNRFYIVVSKAKPGLNPKPQKLEKFARKGFTLVDWGGSILF